jgi:hypothetical protein
VRSGAISQPSRAGATADFQGPCLKSRYDPVPSSIETGAAETARDGRQETPVAGRLAS